MINIKNKIISFLLIVTLLLPLNIYAQNIDVTKSKASEMEHLIDDVSLIPLLNLCYGEKKLSFNTTTKSTMAAALSTYYDARSDKTSLAQAKKNMKLLFGTSTFKLPPNKQYPLSLFKQKGNTIYFTDGDWGTWPYFKIKKVTQLSKGNYLCSVNYYTDGPDGTNYIGNFSFKLKSTKSQYGYIITDMIQNTKCGYKKLIKEY